MQRKKPELKRIFNFLKASVDNEIIDDVADCSTLDVMRANSTVKDFFREGATDMGSDKVSAAVKTQIRDAAEESLQFLNYEI